LINYLYNWKENTICNPRVIFTERMKLSHSRFFTDRESMPIFFYLHGKNDSERSKILAGYRLEK